MRAHGAGPGYGVCLRVLGVDVGPTYKARWSVLFSLSLIARVPTLWRPTSLGIGTRNTSCGVQSYRYQYCWYMCCWFRITATTSIATAAVRAPAQQGTFTLVCSHGWAHTTPRHVCQSCGRPVLRTTTGLSEPPLGTEIHLVRTQRRACRVLLFIIPVGDWMSVRRGAGGSAVSGPAHVPGGSKGKNRACNCRSAALRLVAVPPDSHARQGRQLGLGRLCTAAAASKGAAQDAG